MLRAMAFWIGEESGSWLDLYSQASATAPSPMFRWQGYGLVSSSSASSSVTLKIQVYRANTVSRQSNATPGYNQYR
jgi:hypothetical protein